MLDLRNKLELSKDPIITNSLVNQIIELVEMKSELEQGFISLRNEKLEIITENMRVSDIKLHEMYQNISKNEVYIPNNFNEEIEIERKFSENPGEIGTELYDSDNITIKINIKDVNIEVNLNNTYLLFYVFNITHFFNYL